LSSDFDALKRLARNIDIHQLALSLGVHTLRSDKEKTQSICPFHGGDSFYLYSGGKYPNTAICYGGCLTRRNKKIWDPISLYMDIKKLPVTKDAFVQAVHDLLNIPLAPKQSSPSYRRSRTSSPASYTPNISIEQIDQAHQFLLSTPQGQIAIDYLASRCISMDTITRWRLGLTPLWESSIDFLAAKVEGLSTLLSRLTKEGFPLTKQHELFRSLCLQQLAPIQVQWLAARLDLNHLIEYYGRLCHFNSYRITIPVWADGPPQDGSGHCYGLRFRYVPNLTPQPPIHIGCILIDQHASSRRKYTLLEILSYGQYLVQPRHKPSEPKPDPQIISAHQFNLEVTKCWGRGSVKTLAANSRKDKRYAIAVEGEMDLLALDQALLQTPLHRSCWLISSSNGANNFPEEWLTEEFWKQYARIFFAYDRDRAGQLAIDKIRFYGATLEYKPVRQGKDFNEWLILNTGHITELELKNWLGTYTWYGSQT
jgi:Toprim-like